MMELIIGLLIALPIGLVLWLLVILFAKLLWESFHDLDR